MKDYGTLPGRYPAIIKDYDKVTRTCRVEIPGITEGGDVFPIAEIEYPIGDKARPVAGQHPTEIEMLINDLVWVAFIGGDQRFPLITGYRNPSYGNDVDWRRFHHANIEMTADGIMRFNANAIELNATTTITTTADTATINAKTQINGASLKHNSKSVGDTHTHAHGDPTTGVPS
ncbi:MAG: hypothetical protein ACXWT0_00345 [Methylobacter sp.]